MQKNTITINNIEIAYYANDVESDKTLLFIHGNSLDASTFSHQLQAPLFDHYRMIAIDLPGHGASAKTSSPDDTYNMIGFSDILVRFINSLKLKNVVLIGHSLGGHIAIEASSELNNIIGLIIFGTPPIGMPPAMDYMFLPNPAMPFAFTGELTKNDANQLAASFTKGENDFVPTIQSTDTNFRSTFGVSVAAGKFKNELEICSNLNFPIAILHGEEDALVNLSYLEELSLPTLWENKIHVIDDSGHSPHIEAYAEFNNLLARFLSKFA